MAHRTIFLGGCPGSGKSFLAEEIVRISPWVRHEIAGRLIRDAIDTEPEGNRRPAVANSEVADRFQRCLVERFGKIRSTYDGVILLDGHFVVPTEQGPHPVAAEVFKALGVDQFLIVETDVDVVLERLRLRPTQSWWNGEREALVDLVRLERQHADLIVQNLGRPLDRLDGGGPGIPPEVHLLVKTAEG